MIDRRHFLAGSISVAGTTAMPLISLASDGMSYEQAVASTWAPLRTEGGLLELVRYATLAANSHNTQPWTFSIAERRMRIAPDFARRCPAVDPDDQGYLHRPPPQPFPTTPETLTSEPNPDWLTMFAPTLVEPDKSKGECHYASIPTNGPGSCQIP